MSDQRFADDLRSVLLEDAPRDVPDDLRRRVAAVPATNQVVIRASGPAWRQPIPLWTGALAVAALVVVLAITAARFEQASPPPVGGSPSLRASVGPSTPPTLTPAPTPTPVASTPASPEPTSLRSPTPVPSASVGACSAAEVQGRILGWQGAAGSRFTDVEITNQAARPCLIRGTPGLQLVDAGGRILIDSASAGPSGKPHVAPADKAFELAPGGTLRTQVQASNYCGPAPSLPIDIAFTLPSGGGRLVATPGPGVSSVDATPPCLGSTGAIIAMNGWKR